MIRRENTKAKASRLHPGGEMLHFYRVLPSIVSQLLKNVNKFSEIKATVLNLELITFKQRTGHTIKMAP